MSKNSVFTRRLGVREVSKMDPASTSKCAQTAGGRLATLCLTKKGKLTQALIAADAVRCGIIFDLVIHGRLQLERDAILLDPTPIGIKPHDMFLKLLANEPQRELQGWYGDRKVGLQNIAEELVSVAAWREIKSPFSQNKYTPLDAGAVQSDLDLRLRSASAVVTPVDAAVVSFGSVSGLLGNARTTLFDGVEEEIPPAIHQKAGEARWICEDAVAYLLLARRQYAFDGKIFETGRAGGVVPY